MISLPGEPRISVALCTHNGTAYIAQQLDSLLEQSRLPDELVVYDDASSDDTVSIVEAFVRHSPFQVSLNRNSRTLGVAENFSQAITSCTGDIIFLADQDDVWLPEKIARMVELINSAELDWICCDAELVDASLRPLGDTLWRRVGFSSAERSHAASGKWLDVLLKHYVVAGATLAFRSRLRDKLLPIPAGWPYDAWIAAVLAASGRGGLIDAPLQRYRQHPNNTVGGLGRSLAQEIENALQLDRTCYYREEAGRWTALATRLATTNASSEAKTKIAAKLAHIERRAALPANRFLRIPAVVHELCRGGYARYARNWGSIALDILIR